MLLPAIPLVVLTASPWELSLVPLFTVQLVHDTLSIHMLLQLVEASMSDYGYWALTNVHWCWRITASTLIGGAANDTFMLLWQQRHFFLHRWWWW